MTHEELLTRAISDIVPRKLAEEKLKSGKKLRVYLGIDPTGAKLHLGHSVPLRKLKAFTDAGHEVIFLIGSFTATIGDPTGRSDIREQLTREQIEINFKDYKAQAEKVLDFSKVEIRYNTEWYDKMSSLDFMRISSHFTVQQMMQRDMFKERMKWKVVCQHCKEMTDAPIQFQSVEDKDVATIESFEITCSHCGKKTTCSKETIIPPPNPVSSMEILYPMLQGYDSVMLDVDCEIGGNDQLFNMLCGRKLQKIFKKREKFVLTTKLIEGTDGRKMSKSYNNCVYLTDTPSEMYGRLLSMPDNLIPLYMECCTDIPMAEVQSAEKALNDGSENPKNLKMRLAREIVTMYHSAADAKAAEEGFENVFKNKGVPEDMPEYKASKGESLIDALVASGSCASKSEARRLIEQGGIKVNDKAVTDVNAKAEKGITKVGKRKFVKIF